MLYSRDAPRILLLARVELEAAPTSSKRGMGIVHQPVYMCPDGTIEERRAYKKLLHELKLKSEAEPNKSFVIRNNKIVSASENSSPASAAGT